MDYIDDPALIADIERFASNMTAPTRHRFFELVAQAVDAGRDAERRMSDPEDLRYYH